MTEPDERVGAEFMPNEVVDEALQKLIEAFKTQQPTFSASGAITLLFGNSPKSDEGHVFILCRIQAGYGSRLDLMYVDNVFRDWIDQVAPEDEKGE